MNQHITIPRKPEKDDLYLHLQEAALHHVQRSSGEVWTDYNEHDPGVTLLDALNYVLLETDYRLRFELPDYLTAPDTGFRPDAHALFPPRQVFSVNPVTADDYRKLFLTSIDALKNVWVLPRVNEGAYDILLQVSPERTPEQQIKIAGEVRRLYHAHRNLCERLEGVRFCEDGSDEEVDEIRRQHGRQEAEVANFEAVCRSPFLHAPVFRDLPACYQSAGQLKSYLSVFDRFVEYALNELEELPHWMQLQLSGVSDKKAVWLDMLDQLYGSESNPAYLHQQESTQENRVRRITFLAGTPQWGHDRGKAADLCNFAPESVSGLEAYISGLFNLPKYSLEVFLIEHFLLYPKSQVTKEESFTVSIVLSAAHQWFADDAFRACCEEAVVNRLPAHIRLHLHWMEKGKFTSFRNDYHFWRYTLSTRKKRGLEELNNKLLKQLRDDKTNQKSP